MSPKPPSPDQVLGTALFVGAVCGLLSFCVVWLVAFSIALNTGILKIHFDLTPTSLKERFALFGVFGSAGLLAALLAFMAFRLIMRFGESRSSRS
jgi:hypothetical protein